jgi:anti-sigma factor RsiW
MNPGAEEKKDDELLSAYLDDATNEDETHRVEDRLQADPEARRTLEEWKRQGQILKGMHPDSEPPAELVASEVMMAIQRQLGQKKGLSWQTWVGISAILLVLAIAYFAAGRAGLVPLP